MIQNLRTQLGAFFGRFTMRQRIALLIAVLATIGGLVYLTRWNTERDFKPLYTGLAAEDAGQVTARLKEKNVEYRLVENGSTIQVPSARVAELRLEFAAAGLPKTGRIGYELFDKMSFGATDFAEQVNYQRAIEGELERSFMAIREVEAARVHVTFGKDSIFLESKQLAKASVLLRLKPGATLEKGNILAMQHLAASAVEGLQPDRVSVLDMNGTLLSKPPRKEEDFGEFSELLLEYRKKIEQQAMAKVSATLDPLLGASHYRAGVSVEVDLSSGEQSEEVFDPNKSVMVSQQRTEDNAAPAQPAGVPGTPSNLPRPLARPGTSGQSVQRRTENITFQTSRLVKKTKTPQGVLKKISLSILVDQSVRWEGAGPQAKRILDAPSTEKLKSIREVVAGAVGISTERGDQVVVETLPFEATLRIPPPPAPIPPNASQKGAPPAGMTLPFDLKILPKPLQDPKILALAITLLLLLLVALAFGVRMILNKRRKGKVKVDVAKAVEGASAAPISGAVAAGVQGLDPALVIPQSEDGVTPEQLIALKEQQRQREEANELARLVLPTLSTTKSEVLVKHIADEAKKDPAAVAQVIRTWLEEAPSS